MRASIFNFVRIRTECMCDRLNCIFRENIYKKIKKILLYIVILLRNFHLWVHTRIEFYCIINSYCNEVIKKHVNVEMPAIKLPWKKQTV